MSEIKDDTSAENPAPESAEAAPTPAPESAEAAPTPAPESAEAAPTPPAESAEPEPVAETAESDASSEDALREAAGEAAQATKKMLSGLGKVIKEKSSNISTDGITGKLKSIGSKGSSEDTGGDEGGGPAADSAPAESGGGGSDSGAATETEYIGPIVPYLHGSIKQQRLVALGMFVGLVLIMMMNMGGYGIPAGIFLGGCALGAAVVLLMTSRARVKFTNYTNCINVMFVSMYIGLILGKILGEILMGIDPMDLGEFFEDYEKNAFGVGFFCFVLYCLGFFPSGRLVWSRSFADVWKAGTIVTIFAAVMYIILMPIAVLKLIAWAKDLI